MPFGGRGRTLPEGALASVEGPLPSNGPQDGGHRHAEHDDEDRDV